MTSYKITAQKKEELEKELHERKFVMRTQIRTKVEDARALGDLKENAEYHTSREEQSKNEAYIAEIEEVLKYAEIITLSGNTTAELGSTVEIKKVSDSTVKTYQLVSAEEADILVNRLSIVSPLGSKLLGKKAGDTIVNETPAGAVEYKIVKIS